MRVLIVDGMNVFIRSFVVVPTMDEDGNPIGGITGFLKSLKCLVDETKPDRVVVAWDGEGGSVRRRKIFRDYKEGRKIRLNRAYEDSSPDEQFVNMGMQLTRLKALLPLIGTVQVEESGCEADDVIAFICRLIFPDDQKVIVSSDQDMLQLVENKTVVYSPSKKTYWTRRDIMENVGVVAENFIYVKAFKGDRSDNIPGLGGIGEKTAVKRFPFLTERAVTPKEIREHCEANRDAHPTYKGVLDNWDRFLENVKLMQLTSPIMSADSARRIRISSREQKPKFMFTEFKLKLARGGIQGITPDFMGVFQGYRMRAEALA